MINQEIEKKNKLARDIKLLTRESERQTIFFFQKLLFPDEMDGWGWDGKGEKTCLLSQPLLYHLLLCRHSAVIQRGLFNRQKEVFQVF